MLIKILNFFSLVDNDQKLSLTSIGLYTVLIKLILSTNPGFADIGALLLVLLNYAHKRSVNASAAETVAQQEAAKAAAEVAQSGKDVAKQLEDLVTKVNGLAIRVGMSGK